jgi:hypothetical protein
MMILKKLSDLNDLGTLAEKQTCQSLSDQGKQGGHTRFYNILLDNHITDQNRAKKQTNSVVNCELRRSLSTISNHRRISLTSSICISALLNMVTMRLSLQHSLVPASPRPLLQHLRNVSN